MPLWGGLGMRGKHTNSGPATRAALVASTPGQKPAGKATDALVEFVDIYPTVAEACGLPLPAGLEGHSFLPLLDGPARPGKPAALSQFPRGGRQAGGPVMGYAIRTDRYRLVEWRDRTTGRPKAHELYDLQADPGEDENVAGRPAGEQGPCGQAGQAVGRRVAGERPSVNAKREGQSAKRRPATLFAFRTLRFAFPPRSPLPRPAGRR